MTPQRRRRPGGEAGAGVEVGETVASIPPGADDVPTVRGWVYGPHRGRRRNMIVVRGCPWCGYAGHRHVAEVLAAIYRRSCPVTGRPYWVRAVVERDTGAAVIRHGA